MHLRSIVTLENAQLNQILLLYKKTIWGSSNALAAQRFNVEVNIPLLAPLSAPHIPLDKSIPSQLSVCPINNPVHPLTHRYTRRAPEVCYLLVDLAFLLRSQHSLTPRLPSFRLSRSHLRFSLAYQSLSWKRNGRSVCGYFICIPSYIGRSFPCVTRLALRAGRLRSLCCGHFDVDLLNVLLVLFCNF